MAALDDITAGETFVSMPIAAALFVRPQMRCPFPDFVDPEAWRAASP